MVLRNRYRGRDRDRDRDSFCGREERKKDIITIIFSRNIKEP